jgi:diaminopimelate decarboxylase
MEFTYKKNELFCEGVRVADIVKQVGTPAYIYSHAAFTGRLKELQKAFRDMNPLICYSMKANSNLAVLRALVKQGSGLDIVSGGELERAKRAGCPGEKIVFAGVGKTDEEIASAIRYGVLFFNVESLPEIEAIHAVAAKLRRQATISLRINPDVDPRTHHHISTGKKESKFGVDLKRAEEAFMNRNQFPWVRFAGLHVHIGSQIESGVPFVHAFKKVTKFIAELRQEGVALEFLNIGGGLGVTYHREKPQKAAEYARKVAPILRKTGLKIIMEPGRFVAANSGILATRVLYVKETDVKRFAVVDAAMNDLLRPSFYDAYHRIEPVIKKKRSKMVTYDVVGPVCESGDFLAKGRKLPVLSRGDSIAVFSAGAYGYVMSSNYNTRGRAAEVLVRGSSFDIVKKREAVNDLLAGERIPGYLR